MTKTTCLRILLRVLGVTGLFALAAVFMPMAWMADVHNWLGLGAMPIDPVVEYLARSLSAFYALLSAICLFVAADPQRYRPLIHFVGVLVALLGMILLGVDLSAGMPWWWSVSEGPLSIGFGALVFVLARRND